MAAKTKKRPTTNMAKGVDLTRLTQAEAASLIGKPSVWMRDNGHLFNRNSDNTYDAHDVVRAVQTQFRAADLADNELEPVLQFCEDVADFAVSDYGRVVRLLEGIDRSHGAAGFARVTQQLLETLRENLDVCGEKEFETAERIQKKADDDIDRLKNQEAVREYRTVLVCTDCQKYRWGRTWKSGATPSGYAPVMAICPPCERPSRRRAKA